MKMTDNDRRFFREEGDDWCYKAEFFDLPDDIVLRCCFYSYRYFDWMQDTIGSDLTLKTELSKQGRELMGRIRETDSVSMYL